MNTWYKYYGLVIAVHVLELVIVASTVAIVKLVRPAYSIPDVLVMVAVGMMAGMIYLSSMVRLERHERSD
jgi:hypothetical protein